MSSLSLKRFKIAVFCNFTNSEFNIARRVDLGAIVCTGPTLSSSARWPQIFKLSDVKLLDISFSSVNEVLEMASFDHTYPSYSNLLSMFGKHLRYLCWAIYGQQNNRNSDRNGCFGTQEYKEIMWNTKIYFFLDLALNRLPRLVVTYLLREASKLPIDECPFQDG